VERLAINTPIILFAALGSPNLFDRIDEEIGECLEEVAVARGSQQPRTDDRRDYDEGGFGTRVRGAEGVVVGTRVTTGSGASLISSAFSGITVAASLAVVSMRSRAGCFKRGDCRPWAKSHQSPASETMVRSTTVPYVL